MKFANSTVKTEGYTEFAFSVFGTPGTGGKIIKVTPEGGTAYPVTIVEGKWTEYKITMAQLGKPASLTNILLENDAAWFGTIYLDHIGLR